MTRKNNTKAGKKKSAQPANGPVNISKSTEAWSEYELSDGTILRVRPLLLDVARNGNGPDGNPQYTIRANFVFDVKVGS